MSSDEDDYMSASFIVDSPAKDVRPGLLHNRHQQRSHEIYKKKQVQDAETRERHKPIKIIEAERREEGLQEKIGAGNKGFALLQKMGYKPGSAIGKSGSGTVDPIPIQVKTDRQGLGRAAALEELKEAKRLIRAKRQESSKSETVSVDEFRARLSQKSVLRLVEIDLFKSQKACYQLDSDGGYGEPAEKWFWPKSIANKKNDPIPEENEPVESCSKFKSTLIEEQNTDESEEEEEEEDDFEASEKLEMLTKYLRSTHNYCVWCCVKFDDEKDMQSECPGATRDDH